MIWFPHMELWVPYRDCGERRTVRERFLGSYSSERLALEVANLASSPGKGEAEHYVLDEVPDWIEAGSPRWPRTKPSAEPEHLVEPHTQSADPSIDLNRERSTWTILRSPESRACVAVQAVK